MRILFIILWLFIFSCDDDSPISPRNDCAGLTVGTASLNEWAACDDDFVATDCLSSGGTPYFYFDCGSDVNVLTGEMMCPSDSYTLSSGFNVAHEGQSIGVDVVVRDNQFYGGYEVDPIEPHHLQQRGAPDDRGRQESLLPREGNQTGVCQTTPRGRAAWRGGDVR